MKYLKTSMKFVKNCSMILTLYNPCKKCLVKMICQKRCDLKEEIIDFIGAGDSLTIRISFALMLFNFITLSVILFILIININ